MATTAEVIAQTGVPSRLLRITGAVAVTAGAHAVITGIRGIRPTTTAHTSAQIPTNLDSEFRFYAAWYAVSGVLMLRTANTASVDRGTVTIISAGWLTAAIGRMLSIRSVGRPHPVFLVLTAAEVAIPVLLMRSQQLMR